MTAAHANRPFAHRFAAKKEGPFLKNKNLPLDRTGSNTFARNTLGLIVFFGCFEGPFMRLSDFLFISFFTLFFDPFFRRFYYT